MHTPTRRMDCWTAEQITRPWMHMDLYRLKKLDQEWHNPVMECRAFTSKGNRVALQGGACDQCARLPEDQR